jgi:CAAX protease family protein
MSPNGLQHARALPAAAGLLVLGVLGWVLPAPELPALGEGQPESALLWTVIAACAGSLLFLVLVVLTALGRGWGPRTTWAVRPAFGPLEVVGLLLFWQTAVFVFIPVVGALSLSETMGKFLLTLLSTGTAAVLGGAMWYLLAQARSSTPFPMIRGSTLPRDVALGAALGIAILPLVACGERIGCLLIDFIGAEAGIQDVVSDILEEDSSGGLALSMLFVLVLAPVFEELLFRGFLYNALRRVLGAWSSALISGALFAAIHTNLYVTLPLFVLGVGLALLYERNGSLAAPMAMHSALNAVNIVAILLLRDGGGG